MEFVLQYQPKDSYEWVELDMGDETPAMVYQVNTIGELKDRQTSGSRALSLPKSPHNLRTLGFLDTPDVIAEAAYQPRPCRLFMDGAVISPPEAVLHVNAIELNEGGAIQTQMVAGVKDLFTRLGEVDTSSSHPNWAGKQWTSDAIRNANDTPASPLRWPLVSAVIGATHVVPPRRADYSMMQAFELVPAYHLMTFAKELFEVNGFTLESDLLNDEFANSLYITASKITEPAAPTFTASKRNVIVPTTFSYYGIRFYEGGTITQPDNLSTETINGTINNTTAAQISYFAPQQGSYKVTVKVTNTGEGAISGTNLTRGRSMLIRSFVSTDSDKDAHDKYMAVAAGASDTYEAEFSANIGEYIGLIIAPGNGRPDYYTYVDVEVSITLDAAKTAGLGSVFNIGKSLGIKKYSDFVKAFLQLFGAVIDIITTASDGQNGIKGAVRIYTYNELYRRIEVGQFEDWTDKLVINSDRTDSFAVEGYAQENTISLKENDDDGAADSINISVNNASLDAQKDLFTMAFEAGRGVDFLIAPRSWPEIPPTATLTFPSVPTLQSKAAENSDKTAAPTVVELNYKGCTAHIVRIPDYRPAQMLKFVNMTGARQAINAADFLNLPAAVVAPLSEFRTRYYESLAKMLHNARRITASFRLTSWDIARLDMLTPVYLDMYGAYFYINKINNFGVKPYTEVELIKL